MYLVGRRLPHSSLFGPFLGLILLGGVTFSYFHHLFALLLPLSLVVGGLKSEGLEGWRSGKLGLG